MNPNPSIIWIITPLKINIILGNKQCQFVRTNKDRIKNYQYFPANKWVNDWVYKNFGYQSSCKDGIMFFSWLNKVWTHVRGIRRSASARRHGKLMDSILGRGNLWYLMLDAGSWCSMLGSDAWYSALTLAITASKLKMLRVVNTFTLSDARH